jgi:hypothetical protein
MHVFEYSLRTGFTTRDRCDDDDTLFFEDPSEVFAMNVLQNIHHLLLTRYIIHSVRLFVAFESGKYLFTSATGRTVGREMS